MLRGVNRLLRATSKAANARESLGKAGLTHGINISVRYSHSFENIRNIGVVAHIDAGKTTTTEQMLYICGQTKAVGRVDSGDTVMDFLPQERERGITISSAAISFDWKSTQVNLIDTPGHVDFTIEVERSARVLDGTVIIIDAVAGVQAQTQTVWKQTKKQGIPSVVFVNKMDRVGANFNRALQTIRKKLEGNPVAIQMPIGCEDDFQGAVDLISMSKLMWQQTSATSRQPLPPKVVPLSEDEPIYNEALAARKFMLEAIAENDEEMLQKYLEDEGESLTVPEILAAVRRACLSGSILPALCGASLRGKGVEPLLDSMAAFLPSPKDRPAAVAQHKTTGKVSQIPFDSPDLCALAFKIIYDQDRGPLVFVRTFAGTISSKAMLRNSTKGVRERIHQILRISADDHEIVSELGPGSVGCLVGLKSTETGDTLVIDKGPLQDQVLKGLDIPPPVYSVSVEPESSNKQADLNKALEILSIEDPSLRVEFNQESGQTLLKGIGELHLEIVCDKLRRQFNCEVYTRSTYIGFRETLAACEPFDKEYTYDRHIGAKRMFAKIVCEVTSTGDDTESIVTISDECKSLCHHEEIGTLIDSVQSSLTRGPNGYPVVGLTVKIKSLERDSDTTSGSIRACSVMLIDNMLRFGDHLMLEPLMSLEVDVPEKFVGDILNDLSVMRRAQIHDVINNGLRSSILGSVPLSTMLGYATNVRSMTQGEGQFSMEYKGYIPVDISLIKHQM